MDSGSVKQGKVETLPLVTRPLRDLRCCDGDAVVLECRVKAIPQPDIRWEKDGKLVKMEGDFKSDLEGETASLSIGRVYPEDEGEYTCIAYNRLGKATTSACLIVDVPEEKESLVSQKLTKPTGLGSVGSTPRSTPRTTPTRSISPCVTRTGHSGDSPLFGGRKSRRVKTSSPKFYSVPHNKVVEEGETVRLQCSAAGHPSPWSTWDKDGILVSPSARVRIAERDDLRYLEITEVTAEDAGLYRVTLENEYGRVEATARLDVIGRNGIRPREVRAWSAPRSIPSFSRRLIGSTARVGGTFNLACDIHAAPPPVTSWYRDGELLVRSDRIVPTWDGRTARLEVGQVTTEDSGVYTCVADSPMGSTRCSARLRVIETDDPGDADLRPPVVVAGLPEETIAQEGRPNELQIRVKGTQPMEVVWVKDKVEIPDCADFRYVDYGDGRFGLRIADLFPPDSGEYSCEVFNEHGEAISSTNLRVMDDGFSEDNIELRPQALWFTKTSAPVMTSCGGSAKFSARVSWLGENTPVFKWEVGSNPVTQESQRFKVTNSGEETDLEMWDLEAKDSGLVRCTAQWCKEGHGAGTYCGECLFASCSAELSVGRGTGEKVAATLVRGPADTTALRGDRVVLKAVYSGRPEPTVRWMKAGKELVSSHHVILNTADGVSCLILDPVMADDSGKYVITVQNPHGSDCHFASVAVEGCPDPPAGVPSVSLGEGGAVTVAWCSPPYDGGSMVTGYSVEMALGEDDNDWTVVADRCHCLSHTVFDLTPGQSYTFRIRSHNVHGPSDPSLYSTPINIGDSEEEVSSLGEHKIVEVRPGDSFKEIYDVGEELGKGRYGVVHKVTDKKSSVKMAAKFVRCIKKQDREKVYEEIDIMNCLRHPKLLQLADAFENPRDIVMVMEYISGGELFERVVADDFTLTEKDCILFMRQICEGVDYMHKNSIVHLDLKPENIMCQTRTSHQIKLIDFGLAQKLKPDTPVRVLFGTPEFIPPEIINYEPIGTETDMWSVGVICYVLLSGLSPFMGDNDAETFANITRADYDFDDEAFDSICQDAKDFISALLVNRKEKRLSAEVCLRHRWLTQQDTIMNKVRLCTDKLKKFIIRRKWQKTGNAIRALGRMATLSAASRRNSSNGSGGSPRPSLGSSVHSRMSSLGETIAEDGDVPKPARTRACSERSDSGISDCSSLPSSVNVPLLFGKKFSISEEAEIECDNPATTNISNKTDLQSPPNGVSNKPAERCKNNNIVSPLAQAKDRMRQQPPKSPALRKDARLLGNSENVQKAFAFWKR